jgi:YihY family inner membrane protein
MHEARVESIRDLLRRVGRWIQRHPPVRLTRGMVTGFVRTDGMMYAAAIAYFALLSLFQLAVLGVVLLGLVLGEAEARRLIIIQLVLYTPLSPRDAIDITDAVLETHRSLGLLAVPLLLFSGIGLFFALQRGVSRAFSTTPRGSILREQLVNLGLMALVGALLVASLIIGFVVWLIEAGLERLDLPGGWVLVQAIGLVVPFVLAFVALVLIYRFIPRGPITVRLVWPAAALAAMALTVLQALLSLYATRLADYASVFGPISSAVSLVMFAFVSGVIVLLGANLANARLLDRARPPPPGPDR